MLGGNQHPDILPSYHQSRRATHVGTFGAVDEAAIYAGNHSKHSSETRTRAFSGGSGGSQGPIFPFAKAFTTIKACGRENSTSEEWIDNIAMPENIRVGVGFDEFCCTGGIQKTVEFELREYDTVEGEKE